MKWKLLRVPLLLVGMLILAWFIFRTPRLEIESTRSYAMLQPAEGSGQRAFAVSSEDELRTLLESCGIQWNQFELKERKIDFTSRFVVISLGVNLREVISKPFGHSFGYLIVSSGDKSQLEVAVVKGRRETFKTLLE